MLFTFITVISGCSKSDDSNPLDENNDSGVLAKYDISIDGQRYSGDLTNGNDGDYALASYYQEGGMTDVGMAISNNDIISAGGFYYPNGQENNVSLDENGDSSIDILISAISNRAYSSKSGTAKLIIGEKVNAPDGSGSFIELKVEFQGTFYYFDTNDSEQTAQVSGTYKINLARVF